MSDQSAYVFLGFFLLAALAVPLLPIVLARFVAPRKPGRVKGEPYECGAEAEGDAWIQFRVQYVLFAILFVVFDVEALFLFPWAVVFREMGTVGLATVGAFIGLIAVGLMYAWQTGGLEWE